MKSLPPIAASLAIVLAFVAVYFGAYFTMSERVDWHFDKIIERKYTHEWALRAFRPAAWIEGAIRGIRVEVTYQSPERRLEMQWESAAGH